MVLDCCSELESDPSDLGLTGTHTCEGKKTRLNVTDGVTGTREEGTNPKKNVGPSHGQHGGTDVVVSCRVVSYLYRLLPLPRVSAPVERGGRCTELRARVVFVFFRSPDTRAGQGVACVHGRRMCIHPHHRPRDRRDADGFNSVFRRRPFGHDKRMWAHLINSCFLSLARASLLDTACD